MDRSDIEEELAHLRRMVEDLNGVVVAQGREIDRLSARLARLTEAAAEAEAERSGGVVLSDRPPHW